MHIGRVCHDVSLGKLSNLGHRGVASYSKGKLLKFQALLAAAICRQVTELITLVE